MHERRDASHDAIEGNFHVALRLALSSTCRIFLANMRIKVPAAPPYRYADLSCLCETPSFEQIGGVEALTNPAVIIEVLSPSTEAYDRGDKFTHYKSIASLREYVLVAQHRSHITHYVRESEDKWDYEELNDLALHINLSSLDCKIPLADIYRDVALDQFRVS